MKKILIGLAVFMAITALVLILLVLYYRGEKYDIVYSTYLATTNQEVLSLPGAVCYSNDALIKAIKQESLLEQAGMKSFNIDEQDLIACVIPNYTVERVVGRQNFGLIIVRRSVTNGVSFTVFRGTKRMLQFNYAD